MDLEFILFPTKTPIQPFNVNQTIKTASKKQIIIIGILRTLKFGIYKKLGARRIIWLFKNFDESKNEINYNLDRKMSQFVRAQPHG